MCVFGFLGLAVDTGLKWLQSPPLSGNRVLGLVLNNRSSPCPALSTLLCFQAEPFVYLGSAAGS